MLNIFGALANVARLLPNYLEGQRTAVQDNWRDMQQYNQVQLGQLQNMFAERTLPWRINMAGDEAARSRMLANVDMMSGLEYLAGAGGRIGTALASNRWNPYLFQLTAQRTANDLQSNPSAGWLSDITQQYQQQLMQQGAQPGVQQQPMPGTAEGTAAVRAGTQTPTAAAQQPQ